MNLTEFKTIIDDLYSRSNSPDDVRVCIPIQTIGAICGTPCVDINKVIKGFDWDDKKLMLYPSEDLSKTDHDYLANMSKQAEELGWSVYEMGNLKREVKRLNKRIKELEQQIGN